jgi:hypothetical protein
MVLMLLAIGLFGAITATITSYLLNSDSRHVGKSTLVDELERLSALHSSGALTHEEFSRAKRGLITDLM